MKISVDFSEKEMREILQISDEPKKGPAIKKLALEALRLKKRRLMGERILKGELGFDFPSIIGKGGDRSSW